MFPLIMAIVGASTSIAPPKPIHSDRWILSTDYPLQPLRRRMEGQVYINLVIGVDGRVNNCDYRSAQQNTALGIAACAAVTKHGRFIPALDEHQNPIISIYKTVIDWIIDARYERAVVPDLILVLQRYPANVNIRTRAAVALIVESDGTISNCVPLDSDVPAGLNQILCDQVKTKWQPQVVNGTDAKPVRSVQEVTIGFEVAHP